MAISDSRRHRAPTQTCSRCGEPAFWLVTLAGEPTLDRPGRALAYCYGCRAEYSRVIAVAIPLVLVNAHPDIVMTALYETGCTGSDPATVAEILNVPSAGWLAAAYAAYRPTDA